MTAVLYPSARLSAHGTRTGECLAQHELDRRLQDVLAQVEAARHRLHARLGAARAAEEALGRRRQECEQAAELVAELAELAESLQRSLSPCA
jgi:hypothetical protein